MNTTSKSNDDWLLFDEHTILIKKNLKDILKFRSDGIKFDSLPTLMRKYVNNSSFFNGKRTEHVNIFTDTNEILGPDLEGRIYGKNERIIVHTHGIFVNSRNSADKYSVDKNILSEEEFAELLKGNVPGEEKNEQMKVYREDEVKRKRKSRIEFPCITVLPGNKYLKDPEYFCKDLEFIEKIYGFERNGILISRTLQEPADLMEFIKEKADYFRQTSPLIEPLICSGRNGVEKLFEKYAYRVMPLILSDGEISKDAKDAIDLFDDKKPTGDEFYIAISK